MTRRTSALITVIFIILFIFVLYPTVIVLIQSFSGEEGLTFSNYAKAFTDPYLVQAILHSLPVPLLSSVTSTLLGLIIALVVVKTDLPGRKLFGAAATLPMVIPGFALTLSYIFLFGRNGMITYRWLNITWDVYSWKSVFILQSLNLSTTFFMITSVLVGVSSSLEDAARELGASEWTVFRTVTLPLIQPAIISSTLLSLLRSMADFSTPYIVGGSYNTLATEAYSQLIGNYNTELASTMSMILLVLSIIVFWLYTRAQSRSEKIRTETQNQPPKPFKFNKFINGILWLISAGYTLIFVMLMVAIVLAAFTTYLGGDFQLTLSHIQSLSSRGWNSARNSLVFAIATSFLVSAFGITLAYVLTRVKFRGNKFLDLLATIPYAIPGTFMGIGYALAFSRPPLQISGTWAIVVACTVIRELPMGLRSGVNILLQQDRSVEDAAANLGASKPRAFFDIILPAARPATLVTSLYAFIATVKTLGAIIFLVTPHNKVLAADVFEATVRGDVGQAAALSLLVILMCVVGMLLIFAINTREKTQKWLRNVTTNLLKNL